MCGACPSIVWLWHQTPDTRHQAVMWWPDQGPGTLETTHCTFTSLQSTVYSDVWVDFYSNLMATRGREIVTRMAAATLQRQDLIKCPEMLSWDNTLYVHTLYVHSRGSGGWISSSSDHRSIGAALGESVWDQDRPCQGGKTTETVMMFHVVFFDTWSFQFR